ncbi:hypothetical protein [Blautia sp.]|nr:hypothetical protein [Blautia sp.]
MKFIKIPLIKQMEADYEECASMMDNGEEYECIGEYPWCSDEI